MSILESGQLKLKVNPKAIFSVLNENKIQGKTLLAWKLFGKNKLSVQVRIEKIRKASGDWVIVCSEKSPAKLVQIISGEEKINLFLPGESILIQVQIKEILGDESLLLSIPQSYAQVERRKHLRLCLTEGPGARIRFKKIFKIAYHERQQSFEKFCLDLSAGGISFFINKNEIKFFSIKDEIRKLELVMDDKKFLIDARVVNVIEIDPNEMNHLMYKGWKICLKFDKLSQKDEELINILVFNKLSINPHSSSKR